MLNAHGDLADLEKKKRNMGEKELDRFSTDSTFTHRSECVCAKAQRHQKKKIDRVVFPIYCGLKRRKKGCEIVCRLQKLCKPEKRIWEKTSRGEA